MKQIELKLFFEIAFDAGGFSICRLELGSVISAISSGSLRLNVEVFAKSTFKSASLRNLLQIPIGDDFLKKQMVGGREWKPHKMFKINKSLLRLLFKEIR